MNSELLHKHLDLVIEANNTTNITRITSYKEAELLHIEDSLTALDIVNKAPDGVLGDMGSGAGYPGIPLAIETGRKTVLIESVGKKAKLLEKFVCELDIASPVDVYNGRIEELALEKPGYFSVITARALSQLSILMELASPLLVKGGWLICYKGSPEQEEIQHAKNLQVKLGLKLREEIKIVLSDQQTHRSLYIFEKTAQPKIKLPRHNGFAQKKPL